MGNIPVIGVCPPGGIIWKGIGTIGLSGFIIPPIFWGFFWAYLSLIFLVKEFFLDSLLSLSCSWAFDFPLVGYLFYLGLRLPGGFLVTICFLIKLDSFLFFLSPESILVKNYILHGKPPSFLTITPPLNLHRGISRPRADEFVFLEFQLLPNAGLQG